MPLQPPEDKIQALADKQNIWFVSVRPDGRPHLTPVWFIYQTQKIYIGIDPHSVKSRNLLVNPAVALALEDGSHPLICEGTSRLVDLPLPEALKTAFLHKYEWDITTEAQFNQVVEITPLKWLSW